MTAAAHLEAALQRIKTTPNLSNADRAELERLLEGSLRLLSEEERST